jgi:hypothetical protein
LEFVVSEEKYEKGEEKKRKMLKKNKERKL